MRHHDITDPVDVINFKIAWFQRLAKHLVNTCDFARLLGFLIDVRAELSLPSDIAIKLLPMLRGDHSLYANLIGNFICRAALERLGLYDDTLRPAPAKVEMGRLEDVSLFYHTDTREYEISNGDIGVRFPALYVPVFGMDIADEEYAAKIAMAISSLAKETASPFSITDRFPLLKVGTSLPIEEKSRKISQNSGRNHFH